MTVEQFLISLRKPAIISFILAVLFLGAGILVQVWSDGWTIKESTIWFPAARKIFLGGEMCLGFSFIASLFNQLFTGWPLNICDGRKEGG